MRGQIGATQRTASDCAKRKPLAAQPRSPLQRDVVRDVMLGARECDAWLTLEQLAHMTSYPPASISAQLRHLRKQQHGGYRLEKRCRAALGYLRGVDDRGANGPVWEYRLAHAAPVMSDALAANEGAPVDQVEQDASVDILRLASRG
jgi:hypothetical protein